MLKEIDAFLAKRKKSNRKLARDVAEWVDQAVRIAAENTRKSKVRNSADLEVEDDDEDGGQQQDC